MGSANRLTKVHKTENNLQLTHAVADELLWYCPEAA
jgi:hypothetical protein